jgi:dTDP-4-amino-4,6-dideoxygalactose transaminase
MSAAAAPDDDPRDAAEFRPTAAASPVDPALPALLGGAPADPDGPPAWPGQRPDVIEAITAAARDGAWGRYRGRWSEELSALLAEHHGMSRVELVASGTLAVEMALEAVGVRGGDEVVLAGYDFRGNAQSVLRLGALPVLVDVAPGRFTPSASAVLDALTPKTRAALVSHLHGDLADLIRLATRLRERGVALIEDACQMPGGVLAGRPVGSLGDVSALSFGGSKLLAAGRGGAVLTNDPAIAQRLSRIAWRGNAVGPMSELQAAAIAPQWRTLESDHRLRRERVALLLERTRGIPGLRVRIEPATLTDPAQTPVFYKLGFELVPEEVFGMARGVWLRALQAEGIAIDEGFRALSRSLARSRFRAAEPLPESECLDERVVVLHHPILLASEARIERVASGFRKVAEHAAELANASR